jgi:hypothetical protein
MVIFARDAQAGRRYRCVDTNDIIEVCARPEDSRNGKLVPLKTEDETFIHVNAISHKGRRIREANPAAPLAIPEFYKLELYEGPYEKSPTKRLVVPKPKMKVLTGRKKKGDTPWRGWAAQVRHDMESLLEVVEAEGFWLAETFHYFRVGFRSETCLGIFKAGQLGFPSRPSGLLGQFPAKKPKTDPYLPWKVELGVVMAAEKWDEMLDMLRRYLREFKSRIERRRTR